MPLTAARWNIILHTMTSMAANIIPLLEPLAVTDRAELASWLIDSIDAPDNQDNHDQAWDAEIAKRSEEILAGAVTGVPAAQVFAEIRRRHL